MDLLAIVVGVVGLAAAVAALGFGYRSAVGQTRSVRSVIQACRRLAQGDTASRSPAEGSRRSRELSDSFNLMAQGVQAAVQSLSAERDKLSQVVATMAEGVLVVNAAGQIVISNPAAAAVLGLRPDQLESRQFAEAIREHRLQEIVSQCVAAGQVRTARLELQRPRRVLNVAAMPLLELQTGEVLLTIHDSTGVEQAETSQREFVSNVSHELRNPLAAIRAMVETLESGEVEDQEVVRDFLERISRDVDRMSKLVDDLLELSRLESGRLPLQLGEVLPADLLRDASARFQPLAAQREIALFTIPADHLPPLPADADRLRQVLINLLENALRFTPAGGRITLAAAVLDGAVEFRVEDSGVGIAREHLPHVFERFYKADRSRRDTGTGLGLAIVWQIVEAHGGLVSVASEEGVGSSFSFVIPTVRPS